MQRHRIRQCGELRKLLNERPKTIGEVGQISEMQWLGESTNRT